MKTIYIQKMQYTTPAEAGFSGPILMFYRNRVAILLTLFVVCV